MRLSNDHFELKVRLQLALPPCALLPAKCGECGENMVGKPWHHAGSCKPLRNRQLLDRHNVCMTTIAKYAKRAGGVFRLQLLTSDPESSKRPDAEGLLGLRNYLIDFTCVNPISGPTNINYAQTPGGIHKYAAGRKITKYKDMANHQGATLVPFVMDIFGGAGTEAVDFVTDITKYAVSSDSLYRPDDIRTGLWGELAAAVARHTARAVIAGLEKSAIAAGRGE
jgi:hypothetical protein